jgi:hypothetical protein
MISPYTKFINQFLVFNTKATAQVQVCLREVYLTTLDWYYSVRTCSCFSSLTMKEVQ